MPPLALPTILLSGLVALAAAELVRRHAAHLGLLAKPNARSSHTVPTPSGGGVGIVCGGTLGGLLLHLAEPWPALLTLTAGLLVAIVGFIDDRRPLPAPMRLGAQLLLVVAVVGFGLPPGFTDALGLPLSPLLLAGLAVLGAVYWINLFNFMDGIDGLAAGQALFMLLAAALLALLQAPDAAGQPLFWWLLVLAAATAGFLLLNWPPARIFMGDAGSTYLGFLIATLGFASIAAGWISLWQWLILGALFVTDATVTLCRRLLLRERIFEAHRRHAYQVLSRRWRSHRPVTLAAMAVNLVLLLPLALLSGQAPAFAPASALLAYLVLVLVALRLGAGAPEARTG